LIADFKVTRAQSVRIERRHWSKGFIRLGHDVQCFSYKDVMMQLSPINSTRISSILGKKRAYKALIEIARCYHPDIIMIMAMGHMDADTVASMRQAAPDAIFVGRDVDWFVESDHVRISIAKKMDIVVASNAGDYLKAYKDLGVPRCAFIPCPCDPDIQHPYDVPEELTCDIIFTGKADHSQNEFDPLRYRLLEKLAARPNARLYGCFGRPNIEGLDVFRAISGAKIALSINAVNNIRMYHSDRLVNNLACGTFTLAKRVPDTDLLFREGVHVKYFDENEEFFELADWYLEHDDEREKIARAGMDRAHKEFNCVKMAQHVMDLIDNGEYHAEWAYTIG